ncbi:MULTISPECIES: ABC transporter ATP-binding protein [Alphaproteobacteria]|uniref:Spermidine/putrescine ABC transporter n=2 Tax=Alphaproteobacteria TaxID=28211 RepID=A0A512HGY8_9HYPH|nr:MULTISPECIES: ABC transporter ATP-binding protein [Alphaproteobacteria]GEO84717.1 spermidine/putrescine ABC transporter [Ciceribacter naphthalenivorans]GLR20662.1 spermidine/putrescine ABC transporter [Ciceribacter naphthalenivorans]GLT03518.1 spermidine/putrescine ABC transporter [Sphingomonas psychrolutea]
MAVQPIVTLENVVKSYGTFTALHNINLEIAAGEFVTLLGPSGCGKTTTLRLIGGFETADEGRITLAGSDVTQEPPYRRDINTVFQDYALFPHMTVAENVGYGLTVRANRRPKEERDRRVREALTMVGLADKAGRMPQQLSGGQRQRVAMARALVRQPKVLLLDEPLSALDVKLREAMQVELKHLHQKLGITFLMVTHDQQEALVLSNRIAVMKGGRIAQIGSPSELYDKPATPYVANFIGAANLIACTYLGEEGNIARVKLADDTVVSGHRAENAKALKPGDACLIAIRPERFQTSGVPDGGSAINATVTDQLFHGGRFQLELVLDGAAAPLFIEIPRNSVVADGTVPQPGNRITLGVAPPDVLVYAAEEDA